ncbi:MAG: DNA-directed RNA polymerase, subunit E'' [Methanobrevibacter sp.]|jgi:DNA-directed RNA polymerase subunit E"|nr:DNA-directed RNA polymerase, subunit E'' [Candidatus Methanoflexus mossambicus]
MSLKSCVACKRIFDNKDSCPICGSKTSENWSGFLVIIDPEKSDISKELNIKLPGEYSLKVR